MIDELHISGLWLVVVVILGAVLYVSMRWVRNRLTRLSLSKPRRALIDRVRPLVEAVATVLYVVISVRLVLGGDPIYQTFVLGVVIIGFVWIGWSAIRDVVAGLLLKASELCMPGDYIEVDGVGGRVRGLGYRVIALETPDGGQAFIPYSRISRQTLVRKPVTDGVYRHNFEIDVAADVDIVEGVELLRRHALNSHWHSVVQEPTIEVREDGTFLVTVYAIAPNQGHRIESSMRRDLETSSSSHSD